MSLDTWTRQKVGERLSVCSQCEPRQMEDVNTWIPHRMEHASNSKWSKICLNGLKCLEKLQQLTLCAAEMKNYSRKMGNVFKLNSYLLSHTFHGRLLSDDLNFNKSFYFHLSLLITRNVQLSPISSALIFHHIWYSSDVDFLIIKHEKRDEKIDLESSSLEGKMAKYI